MTQVTPTTHLVLYADDDRDDIALVEEAFSETTNNVELITAYDGAAALNYLQGLTQLDPNPCLIILDVNMPRLDGRETLLQIRQMERFRTIPVVLFTTSSMPYDELFAERHNAGFITKPLNSEQMKKITDVFLDHCTDEIKKTMNRF